MKEKIFIRSYRLVPEIRNPLIKSSLIVLLGTGLRMVGPWLISKGVDEGVVKSDYSYVLQISLFYLLTVVALYFVTSKAILAIGLVGETYVRQIREKLFRHLTSLDINYFEKNKTGVLVARLTSDMQSLNEFAREGASSVLTSLLTIFAATVAVFFVDFELSVVAFIILPLLGVATRIFRKHADTAYWAVREWIGQVLSSLQEGISGVRIIQAYGDEKTQIDRFEDVNQSHLDANLRSAKNIAIYFPFIEITRVTSIATVIWFGAQRIFEGTLTIGELVALLFYLRLSYVMSLGMLLFSGLCLTAIYQIELLFQSVYYLFSLHIGIFIFAWILQFIGHEIEGKKPAFVEDLKFLLIGPAWLLGFLYKKAGIKLSLIHI